MLLSPTRTLALIVIGGPLELEDDWLLDEEDDGISLLSSNLLKTSDTASRFGFRRKASDLNLISTVRRRR